MSPSPPSPASRVLPPINGEKKTALILLASGLSNRFGSDDKLLAYFRRRPLMNHAMRSAMHCDFAARFAVVPANAPERIKLLKRDFIIIENETPEIGQGHSLSLGAEVCLDMGYTSACVMLADMPFVKAQHVKALIAEAVQYDITISRSGDRALPPAIFARQALQDLTQLTGDKGASALDFTRYNVKYVDMHTDQARDIDTPDDLLKYET